MLYLLDFAEGVKEEKPYRVATFFDPTARRKVVTKFLDKSVKVPTQKLVTADDFLDLQSVEVITTLAGEVKEIV